MATYIEGQEISLANTNAYAICDSGERWTLAVRLNDGFLYRVWFSREPGDEAGTLRAKSNFSAEEVSMPVAEKTQIPGIPADVETTGDMVTGTMVFTTHVEP